MTLATCPRCSNAGAVGERYCDCPAAVALRARIDADERIAEARAKIDRLLVGRPEIEGIPPSYGWMRPIAVPSDAPPAVQEQIRAYNALIEPNPEVN